MKVTSTEFQQNVGRYQDAALQSPVAITKNGRTHTVLMSASFFEMVMKGRVARSVEELDDDTLKAIANSVVAPEFAPLDKIMTRDVITDQNREKILDQLVQEAQEMDMGYSLL